jgi:23S rRNA (uracil1939-C5)-methyltransferase
MSENLEIKSLGSRGEGIANGPDGPIFVPYTLPSETVMAETAGNRGFASEILTPSPDRVAPFCRHFTSCGGCATQHMAPPLYANWKRGLLVTALQRAGLEAEIPALVDAHCAGRRRVTLHVRYAGTGRAMRAEAGFMQARSHTLIDLDACPILVPALAPAPAIARAIGNVLKGRAKPLDVQVTATLTGLDIDIRGSGRPSETERLALGALVGEHNLARLSVHGELVLAARMPLIAMGKAAVVPPPASFLQATESGEATLAKLVGEATAGAKRVADLFCGVGPFALRLAEKSAVAACDSNAPSIAALKTAAARTQGLKPIAATERDLFRRPLTATELNGFDALVFDPPRAGAEAQARQIAASRVARVVAVSCDPGTFARDAKLLVAGGYRLERITPVDQFRHSAHLELVATFSR